jgi:xanthine dehydrogenase YagR molybdenum-binding subunit
MLAIEAQGKDIQTIEGLSEPGKLHPLQQAFVDNDAQQCGYCTPGFVMACKAFLDKNPIQASSRCARVWEVISAVAARMWGLPTQFSKPPRRKEDAPMPKYEWPEKSKRAILGQRVAKLDSPDKASGRAKYASDLKRPGQLYAKFLRCPYAHAKVVSIDISAAEKMPGVKAVKICEKKGPGSEILWALDEVVGVVAVDEHAAEDALRKIVVRYEKLPHLVNERDLSKAGDRAKPAAEQVAGDPDKAFQEAEVVIEGEYWHSGHHSLLSGTPWTDHGVGGRQPYSTSLNPERSGMVQQFAQPLQIPASNIKVSMDHIGGGFGSKFGADSWGLEGAHLSKQAGGKPVKIFLERDAELFVAGVRPSHFARIKVGAKKDGTLTAWEHQSWSTGGPGWRGHGAASIRAQHSETIARSIRRSQPNTGPQRAWRAPESSASLLADLRRSGRHGCQVEHGFARLLPQEPQPGR